MAALAARDFEGRILLRTILSSVIAGAMLWLDIVVFYPVYPSSSGLGRLMFLVIIVAGPYYVIAASVGAVVVRRRFRRATRWLDEERQPTQQEVLDLISQPQRVAWHAVVWWVGSYAWTIPYLHVVVGYRPGIGAMAKITIAYTMAAAIAWTLTEILVGRALRPLRAVVLTPDVKVPRTMGIFPRLLLVWIVVSARPLVEAGGMMVGLTSHQLERVIPVIWGICFASTVAGIIVTALSARAISDPLEKLRRGLLAVERGDLAYELPVDEAGEFGTLQAGFNRMVTGLRDRERLRELFDRHVGSAVAQRALDGEHGLGGEVLNATAMFVDVIGSTDIAENRPPGEVVLLLNAFFDTVVRAVDAEGGFVNKFEGDGALCVFGAPLEMHDHASCALRAALNLRIELEALAGQGIAAGIGVSSGHVVAGNVGARNRYEFTVVGDPVNEAARLTEEAKVRPSRLLVSESTILSCTRDVSDWHSIGPLQLRGRKQATTTYEPIESRDTEVAIPLRA